MQTTFFVKFGFWVEGLGAKRYKNHVSRKKKIDKMVMTLQSLKTYGYISSKIKSYQI